MRPYFMYLPFPLPLSIADKQRRGGQGVRFPALSRKTGANATVRPPFAALRALCETVYPLTLPAVRPSTRNFCPYE